MKYLFGFLLLVLCGAVSCQPKAGPSSTDPAITTLPGKSQEALPAPVVLVPTAQKALDQWPEYSNLAEFLARYRHMSISEVLANAQELATLTRALTDSIRITSLKEPAVIARLHVLDNQALRLADMADIPSIKDIEVGEEHAKVQQLFAAINAKINTLYTAERLRKALEASASDRPVEAPVLRVAKQ
ncbi:MAG: hypothetical protein QGH06_01330 [Lutibacter sp.]|nr:hypothetical protein [Lutibacter sp.]